MFFLLLGAFSQDPQTCTFVRHLTKPQQSSADCLLPWDVHVCLASTKLFSVHLRRGIVIFSFECGSNTRWDNKIRQMERSSTVSFTGLQTTSAFLTPFSTRVPAVPHLLVTEDASSEKGGKMPGGISHFTHTPPRAQVTLTKAKVAPAGLRWWGLNLGRESRSLPPNSGALTDLPSLPPKPAGWRKHLSPPPALQASLLLLFTPPVPHIRPPHETPNEIMKSSSVHAAQLKVTAACEFTF